MSYSRICSMRSIQKNTFCGFIALLNKVLDFGGQLVNKLSFLLMLSFISIILNSLYGCQYSLVVQLVDGMGWVWCGGGGYGHGECGNSTFDEGIFTYKYR